MRWEGHLEVIVIFREHEDVFVASTRAVQDRFRAGVFSVPDDGTSENPLTRKPYASACGGGGRRYGTTKSCPAPKSSAGTPSPTTARRPLPQRGARAGVLFMLRGCREAT
jgi:hypothetical protein